MSDRRETVVNVERPATHTETVYRESSNGASGILVLLVVAAIVIGLIAFFLWRPGGAPEGTSDTNVTVEQPAAPAPPPAAEPAPAPPPSASEPATPPPAATPEPAPAPEPPAATPEPAPAPAPAPSP